MKCIDLILNEKKTPIIEFIDKLDGPYSVVKGFFVANVFIIDVYNDISYLKKKYLELDEKGRDTVYSNLSKMYDSVYAESAMSDEELLKIQKKMMSEDKKRKNNINETIPTVVQRNTEDELQEWVQNLDELLTSTVIRSRRTTQVSILTIMLDKLDTLRMNSFAVTHAICMNNVQANNCNIENLKKSFDEKLKETKILFLQILLSFIAIMFAIGFGILYLIEVQGFSNVIQSLKYLFAWVCAIIALLTFFLKKILKLFK